jgi:hypothetical protein
MPSRGHRIKNCIIITTESDLRLHEEFPSPKIRNYRVANKSPRLECNDRYSVDLRHIPKFGKNLQDPRPTRAKNKFKLKGVDYDVVSEH